MLINPRIFLSAPNYYKRIAEKDFILTLKRMIYIFFKRLMSKPS